MTRPVNYYEHGQSHRERELSAELKEARRLVTILSVLSGVAALALLFMYLYMMYNGGN